MSIFFALIIERHYGRKKIERHKERLSVIFLVDVMSTLESNIKNQLIVSTSAPSSSQPAIPSPLSLPTAAPLTLTTSLPPSLPAPFYDDKPIEKLYKKEKQILLEFDQIVKGRKIFVSSICHEKKYQVRRSPYASVSFPSLIKYLCSYRVLYINTLRDM